MEIELTSSTDVDLGAVVGTETSTAATLSLGQNVHRHEELVVGLGAVRGSNDHAAADVLTTDTTEQETGVVTSTGLVTGLLEGLNIGNLSLDRVARVGGTDNFNLSILLQETTLDTARDNSTTARDGEDFLNGHKERLVHITLGGGNPGIDGLHELLDLLSTNVGAAVLKGTEGRAEDDRSLLALKSVRGEQLTHLKLDELKHLRVLDSIDLINEHNNLLNTNLAGKEQVLTGLGPVA